MHVAPVRIVTPLPFALASANSWLWPGRNPVLLDCGIGTPQAYEALVAGIRAAGVDPRRLRLLVSHGHVDHAGNAARLARDFGIPLSAPRVEAPFLETFRRDSRPRNALFAEAMALHGAPADVVGHVRARGEDIDVHLEDTRIEHPLVDDERLAVGDDWATVHLAPGHTPGSILLHGADNLLATGDTLLEHITSNAIELMEQDRGRYHQYLRTLAGLRRFVGCDALPGHHDPFKLTDALLDHHIAKHERRSKKILDCLDVPRTAWELLPRVLPHLAKDQTFLGMCEVVGHLHALEIDGKATSLDEGGNRRFRRT